MITMIMTGILVGMIAKLTEGRRIFRCLPIKNITLMNNQLTIRHILQEHHRTISQQLRQLVIIGHIRQQLQLDLIMEQQLLKRNPYRKTEDTIFP